MSRHIVVIVVRRTIVPMNVKLMSTVHVVKLKVIDRDSRVQRVRNWQMQLYVHYDLIGFIKNVSIITNQFHQNQNLMNRLIIILNGTSHMNTMKKLIHGLKLINGLTNGMANI